MCIYLHVSLFMPSLLNDLDHAILVTSLPVFLSFANVIGNTSVFLFFSGH